MGMMALCQTFTGAKTALMETGEGSEQLQEV
jgi:hypothetical protein